MSIDAVLFDVDDTLIDHSGAVREGFLTYVSQVLPGVDAEMAYSRWRELEDIHYSRYLTGELTWQGSGANAYAIFFAHIGIAATDDASHDAWFDGFRVEMEAATKAFDDTAEALQLLGIPVGVVSNNEIVNIRLKLARCGLGAHFDVIVCPSAEGLPAKPDPRIFLTACAELGSDPATTAYVGDLLVNDAVGARDAGLIGVWLDRHGDDPVVPAGVRRITTLPEIVALVRSGTV